MDRLLRDTHGAAMVEGVIVLPLFILCLAVLLHLHRSYGAKLDANLRARECAWAYSVAGCIKSTKLPEGCNIERLDKRNPGHGTSSLDGIGSDVGLAGSSERRGERNADSGALAGTSRIARTLLGMSAGITSRPSQRVKAPSILGGKTRQISVNYSVMCNERDMTPAELAKYAYCSFGDLKGCP